jgi:hypothetical protein
MTEMKQFAKRLCNIVIGCANKAKNIRYCRKLLLVTFIKKHTANGNKQIQTVGLKNVQTNLLA